MADAGSAAMGPMMQIGYIVDDLDQAMAQWRQGLGVGPWTIFRNVTLDGRYLGQPTSVQIDVALSYQGEMQMELIEQRNTAASPYRGEDGPKLGIHHVAWLVDDLDVALARFGAGHPPVFEAQNPGTRVAYVSGGQTGVLWEFIESPATREAVATGLAASRDWDGQQDILAEYDFAAH